MMEAIHNHLMGRFPKLIDWCHHVNEPDKRLDYWCTGKTPASAVVIITITVKEDKISISYNGFIRYNYDINDPTCFDDLEYDINEILKVWQP